MNQLTISDAELADNPTARVPICVLLDVSDSMKGDPIRELNEGLKAFIEEILSDDMTRYSADIAILTFGGIVKKVFDFGRIEDQEVPEFKATSTTPMAKAVLQALEMLEERKKSYKDNGVDYYQPWVVLMTDGMATDDPSLIEAAAKKTKELINNKKLVLFPIAIGNNVDLQQISSFGRQPKRLEGLKFKEFFAWLSQSVSTISDSMPGDKILLPPTEGWETLMEM